MAGPTQDFWQQRFKAGETPWDRGAPHPQLLRWLAEGLISGSHLIAVPGCGSGHEMLALGQSGVAAIGLDYAPAAVALARERLGALPGAVEQADVLEWMPSAPLDRVYEQTCLCALHPDHWRAYAEQLRRWLKPGGMLLALFMQARRDTAGQGFVEGPPYHGDINAMRSLFPASQWDWPAPPYEAIAHPSGWNELPVALTRK